MNVIQAIIDHLIEYLRSSVLDSISARPEHLDKLEKLFAWINSTRSGHSGGASIYVDGDGAARVTIEKEDGELSSLDDEEIQTSQKIEFSVGLE